MRSGLMITMHSQMEIGMLMGITMKRGIWIVMLMEILTPMAIETGTPKEILRKTALEMLMQMGTGILQW
jgi:hypothetical protein